MTYQLSADSARAGHARAGCPSAARQMPCSGRRRAQQPRRPSGAPHARGCTTDSLLHDAGAQAVCALALTGPPGTLQSHPRRSPLRRLPRSLRWLPRPHGGAEQRRERTSRWLASSAAARCCGTTTSFCLPLASAGRCASAARDAADGPCAPARQERRKRAAGGRGSRPAEGLRRPGWCTAGGSLRAAVRRMPVVLGTQPRQQPSTQPRHAATQRSTQLSTQLSTQPRHAAKAAVRT